MGGGLLDESDVQGWIWAGREGDAGTFAWRKQANIPTHSWYGGCRTGGEQEEVAVIDSTVIAQVYAQIWDFFLIHDERFW